MADVAAMFGGGGEGTAAAATTTHAWPDGFEGLDWSYDDPCDVLHGLPAGAGRQAKEDAMVTVYGAVTTTPAAGPAGGTAPRAVGDGFGYSPVPSGDDIAQSMAQRHGAAAVLRRGDSTDVTGRGPDDDMV